jgi:hypothetical protein
MENRIARQTTQVPICRRHGWPVSRHRRYRRGSPGRDGAGFGVYVRPPQLAAFFTSAVLLSGGKADAGGGGTISVNRECRVDRLSSLFHITLSEGRSPRRRVEWPILHQRVAQENGPSSGGQAEAALGSCRAGGAAQS